MSTAITAAIGLNRSLCGRELGDIDCSAALLPLTLVLQIEAIISKTSSRPNQRSLAIKIEGIRAIARTANSTALP
jgi:hypothetical protein